MSTLVTINTISAGTQPYDVWVCDTCYGTCQYIDTISGSSLPYSFTLPAIYDTYPSYTVKIIDDNNCVYCQDTLIYKQFQDDELFEFMDGEDYEFQ
jgi:hypothetical protein